jgi:hypothetical protein
MLLPQLRRRQLRPMRLMQQPAKVAVVAAGAAVPRAVVLPAVSVRQALRPVQRLASRALPARPALLALMRRRRWLEVRRLLAMSVSAASGLLLAMSAGADQTLMRVLPVIRRQGRLRPVVRPAALAWAMAPA